MGLHYVDKVWLFIGLPCRLFLGLFCRALLKGSFVGLFCRALLQGSLEGLFSLLLVGLFVGLLATYVNQIGL